MLKRAIGERITSAYRVFVVALPNNQHDSFISVSTYAPLCYSGMIYYEGNTAEQYDAYHMEMSLLTPEWAKIHIPGYHEGMKLLTVYAFCNHWISFDEAKANDRLRNKLSSLTRYEFYNSKW